MSLVSNYIGSISPSQFSKNGVTAPNFDLNDRTFADLLEGQLQRIDTNIENKSSIFDSLGMPSGLDIQNIDSNNIIETLADNLVNSEQNTTSSEVLTFMTNFNDKIHSNSAETSDLMDFAKKQAANFYSKYSQNVVMNISEFVEDVQTLGFGTIK